MTSPSPVRVETARDVYLDYLVRGGAIAFVVLLVWIVAGAIVEFVPARYVDDPVGALVGGTTASSSAEASSGGGGLLTLVPFVVAGLVLYRYPWLLSRPLAALARGFEFVLEVCLLPLHVAVAPVVVVHEWTHVLAARAFGIETRVDYVPLEVGPFSLPVPAGGECVPEPYVTSARIPTYQLRLISVAPIVMTGAVISGAWVAGLRDLEALSRLLVPCLFLCGPSGPDWMNVLSSRSSLASIGYDVGTHLDAEGIA